MAQKKKTSSGPRIKLALFLVVIVGLAATAAYFGTVTIPAPSQPVESEISHDALLPKS